jgi:serine/threonine protein kinase
MSIVGKALGEFDCTALLGRGGMGKVYKAQDQRLGRGVTIEALPEESAEDAGTYPVFSMRLTASK